MGGSLAAGRWLNVFRRVAHGAPERWLNPVEIFTNSLILIYRPERWLIANFEDCFFLIWRVFKLYRYDSRFIIHIKVTSISDSTILPGMKVIL